MRKRFFIIFTLILIMLLIVCICFHINSTSTNVPDEILEFYSCFLTEFSQGTYASIDPFLYFEIPEFRELTEEGFCNLTYYHINWWEQVNDNLWVAETYVETALEQEGYLCYHFLGYIDDQLYVMIGRHQVPDVLSLGEDLSRYSPPDAIPFEDIIF